MVFFYQETCCFKFHLNVINETQDIRDRVLKHPLPPPPTIHLCKNNAIYEGLLLKSFHFIKNVFIWSFSGLYFMVFGVNMESYKVNLGIQSQYEKIRIIKVPNTATFYAVCF